MNAPSQQAMLPTAAITPNCENPRKLVVPSARYDADAASAAVSVGRAVVAIAADSAWSRAAGSLDAPLSARARFSR